MGDTGAAALASGSAGSKLHKLYLGQLVTRAWAQSALNKEDIDLSSSNLNDLDVIALASCLSGSKAKKLNLCKCLLDV